MLYQAKRANMVWVDDELFRLFAQFHDSIVLNRLHCGPQCPTDIAQQTKTLSSFLELMVCTAGERSWYMLHFTYTFPEQWAGMLAPLREGLDAFNDFKTIADVILKAEVALQDPNHDDRVVA